MLKKLEHINQVAGEPRRRWFEDDYFDLIIWQGESEEIVQFELCYDKSKNQRAVRWEKSVGYAHYRVDDGDRPGKRKASPVLFSGGDFDFEKIARLFALASREVEERIAKFVYKKTLQYLDDSKNPDAKNKGQ